MDAGIILKITFFIEVIVAFGFMISIHEGGHYLACRLFGVDVEEFALGFGPLLFSRKWGKTLYTVRALPLGGFCKPKGGDLSGETADKMYENPPVPGEFLFAPWWKRVFIFLAGPGMNYLSSFTLIFLLFWAIGERTPIEKPILGFVPPHSLAEQAGLRAGDHLLKVEGDSVQNLFKGRELIAERLLKDPAKGVALGVEREGKTLEVVLKGDIQKAESDLGIYASTPPIVGSVNFSSPARKAGLKEGDKILAVEGHKVSEWGEMHYLLENSTSDEVHLEIDRDGKAYPISLRKIYDGMGKHIGISNVETTEFEVKRLGMVEALSDAGVKTAQMTELFVGSLWQMFQGKISFKDNVAGPVTMMRLMYQKASQGWAELFNIVAFISLLLCIMNLLPIPVVDGGQIVLCVAEGIKRKPVPVKIQMVYQQIGFFLVVGLMLFAVFNDVWGWVLERFHSQIH